LGTGYFAQGVETFSGLHWRIPAGRSRHLFVTADVSAHGATDGDVLSAEVADGNELAFAEATAVTAGWPLDSGARAAVDGFTAAQLVQHPTQPVTVGPNDHAILAMDFVVPADGYLADAMRSVRV